MQGPNPLNREITHGRIEEGVRRAELSRAVRVAEAARRNKGQARNPWGMVTSALRRTRVPASTPSAPAQAARAVRKPITNPA